jgi:hypothetical protein
MLVWQKPSLDDKALFESFLCFEGRESYETSFASQYIWRHYTNLEYAIRDNVLLLHNYKKGKGTYYKMPCGYKKENLPELIEFLQKERPTDYIFGEVDEFFALDVEEMMGDQVELIALREDEEYIYSVKELIELRGRRFHGKRNHYNYFIKNYEFQTVEIKTPEIIEDCLDLIRQWFSGKGIGDAELLAEQNAIVDTLEKLEELRLKSMALYVDNKLVGFTIGERLTPEMTIIHFEKAYAEYRGAYNYLNQYFLEEHFSDTLYVNRQEDAGDEGLRQAKLSYRPIRMLKKYYIRLKD